MNTRTQTAHASNERRVNDAGGNQPGDNEPHAQAWGPGVAPGRANKPHDNEPHDHEPHAQAWGPGVAQRTPAAEPCPFARAKGSFPIHTSRHARRRDAILMLPALLAALVMGLLGPHIAHAQPNGWTQRTPAASPLPRLDPGMAYDAVRGVSVLFGGIVNGVHNAETWEWNGTAWTQRAADGPSARSGFGLVYDAERRVTVLFGGYNTTRFGETWTWDGTTWTRMSTSGPSPRYYSAMAYDSNRRVTVLFGGYPDTADNAETWEWSGTTWTQRSGGGPSPRHSSQMVYDAERHVCVLFGGAVGANPAPLSDTWEWDGNMWTQRNVSGPSARRSFAMAYDTQRHVTVLFGGQATLEDGTANGETWEWNGTAWTQRQLTGPSPREYHAMVYDAARGTTVLFGGYNGPYNGETWELAFPVIYVNKAAAGSGPHDGSSWANAFTELRDALAFAAANSYVREIWVARGTYTPSPPLSQGGSRSASFNLQNNLAIYGGFVGTETALSQRPPLPTNATDALDPAKATILSGDLNGDDNGDLNKGDNSYHVVVGTSTDQTAILDGVTVVRGYANDELSGESRGKGGGLFLDNGSLSMRACMFLGNEAIRGGAVFCSQTSIAPLFTGCSFSSNSASPLASAAIPGAGGAVWAESCSPVFRACSFTGNTAGYNGGACHFDATIQPAMIDCRFTRNTVLPATPLSFDAAGGGAIANESNSHLFVVNCVFVGNSAQTGSAILTTDNAVSSITGCVLAGNLVAAVTDGASGATIATMRISGTLPRGATTELRNSTLASNVSADALSGAAGVLVGSNSQATVSNCLLWRNVAGNDASQLAQVGGPGPLTISYSSVEGWTGSLGGTGNNGLDPHFMRTPSPGPDGVWGTADDDYGDLRLSPGSPAIDSGDSLAVPADTYDIDGNGNTSEALPIDLAGRPRFVDDPLVPNTGVGSPPVDRGCYEGGCPCATPHLVSTRTWIARHDANYDECPDVWCPSPPTKDDDTLFNVDLNYTVNVRSTGSAKSLKVRDGSVTLNLVSSGVARTLSLTSRSAAGALIVGDQEGDSAALTVQGGALSTQQGAVTLIGNAPGSSGTLNVLGAGASAFLGGSACVGCEGSGVMNITDGASVTAFILALADAPDSAGVATVRGTSGAGGTGTASTLNIPFFGVVGNSVSPDPAAPQAAVLDVREGGVVNVGPGGLLVLQNGLVRGNGTINGDVISIGKLTPGNSPGTLTINGSYEQVGNLGGGFAPDTGTLEMEVAGVNAGQYDRLVVSGPVQLAGGLRVKFPGGIPADLPGATGALSLVSSAGGAAGGVAASAPGRFDVAFLPSLGTGSGAGKFLNVGYFNPGLGRSGGAGEVARGAASEAESLVSLLVGSLGSPITGQPSGQVAAERTPSAAVTADVDGDGLEDLVITVPAASVNGAGNAIVFLNAGVAGDGTWNGFQETTYTFGVGANPQALLVQNVMSMGGMGGTHPAVIVANAGDGVASGTVQVLGNMSMPGMVSLSTSSVVAVGRSPSALAAGTFTNSTMGLTDIAVANADDDSVTVLRNLGGAMPTLATAQVVGSVGKKPIKLGAICPDQDALPNQPPPPPPPDSVVVLCRDDAIVRILPNPGTANTASLSVGVALSVGPSPVDMYVPKLKMGGVMPGTAVYQDIVVVNQGVPMSGVAGSVAILVNTGGTTDGLSFAPAVYLDAGGNPVSVAPADLDKDGDTDLAVLTNASVGTASASTVQVLRNDIRTQTLNQSLIFAPDAASINPGPAPVSIVAGNLTGPAGGPKTDVIGINNPALGRAILAGRGGGEAIGLIGLRGAGASGRSASGAGVNSAASGEPGGNEQAAWFDPPKAIYPTYSSSVPTPSPACRVEYNLDGALNPDDIGDYITDYFTNPPVAGPGGYAVLCPGNAPPYDKGYKAGYTSDGVGQCGEPNPDNLGDWITDYFIGCAGY